MSLSGVTFESVWTSGACTSNNKCEWSAISEPLLYENWHDLPLQLTSLKDICISISGTYPYKWEKVSCSGDSLAICESPKQGK